MNMRPCVTPEAIATVARAAEHAGFESFWGGEHLALADPQTPASPMPPRIDFVDLNVTMAFAAAHTRTLRFGTGIMILPLRNPVVLAKQLASVDVMSGGRLIFGIGIGNLEFEFNAVGMPFDHKGKRAEEALAAMKALWTMERAEFHGRYFSFADVRAEPRPVQRPHPEIVFGGKTSHAFSRTARLGNGGTAMRSDLARDARLYRRTPHRVCRRRPAFRGNRSEYYAEGRTRPRSRAPLCGSWRRAVDFAAARPRCRGGATGYLGR